MTYAYLKLHRAIERARWLAELAAALDQAEKLARTLCERRGDSPDAVLLRNHIVALRSEVDALQRGRRAQSGEIDPNWM